MNYFPLVTELGKLSEHDSIRKARSINIHSGVRFLYKCENPLPSIRWTSQKPCIMRNSYLSLEIIFKYLYQIIVNSGILADDEKFSVRGKTRSCPIRCFDYPVTIDDRIFGMHKSKLILTALMQRDGICLQECLCFAIDRCVSVGEFLQDNAYIHSPFLGSQ